MKDAQELDLLGILLQRNELNQNHERMLRLFMNEWGVTPFEALIESKILSEGRLADIICEHFSYQRITTIERQSIDAGVSSKVPYLEARRLNCLAIGSDEDGACRVVVCDPTQSAAFSMLKKYIGPTLVPLISTRSEINIALNEAYSPEEQFGGI